MATDKRLPVIYYGKVLNFDAYVSGNQFSATTPNSMCEPITSHKSETAILRNIGRFPFDQKFWFEISGIPCDEWNGISWLVDPTRPRPSRSKFRAKIQTVKQGKILYWGTLCFFAGVVRRLWSWIGRNIKHRRRFNFFSVASFYLQRNLNRVYDYFESTIPLRFPDEFKSLFRMTRETCELFTHEVMPTGRIPLGNGSGRAPIKS